MFQCHMVIVSACSPVLQAMTTTAMVEATKRQVTLHDIPSSVMELLMEYMYKGETNIPPELLLPTTEACDYLQLMELRKRCLRQAPNVINPVNAVSWYKFAYNLNIDELKNRCLELIYLLTDVSKGSDFLELGFTEVSSCISDAQEMGADGDDLLEATINWVGHKQTTRQDHILDMLEKLDLTQCSVECLNTVIDNKKELLNAQPDAMRKLMKSVLQLANQPSGNITKKRSERGSKDAQIIVISGHEGYNVLHSDCWHLDKNMNFVDLCNLPFSFPWHSVCQIPGGFVVTGGEKTKLCAMFMLSTKSWKQLRSLPTERDEHASIFMKGRIFLFGGFAAGASSVISLDLDEGKWNQEPDMPIGVYHPVVACVDSSIFLFDSDSTTFEGTKGELLQLDLVNRTWSTKAQPPQQKYRGARMISVHGQLFICGGRHKVFAQYNPSTDTWTTGNAPTLEHYCGALVHHDQKLCLIGGENEDRVEEYDLDTKAWSVCDVILPKKLCNLYAFAV